MQIFKLTFLSIIILLLACTHTSYLKMSPEEKNYLEQVKRFPTEFLVDRSEIEQAWGRAQSFIGRYSSMKLQTATDYIIQTYNPLSGDVDYGYSVTRTDLGPKSRISVGCIGGNVFSGSSASHNAHILAYYIKTGELPYPRLIER